MKPKHNGRDVTHERAHGEPERIRYDPARHPGIIKRALSAGWSLQEIAPLVGVSEATLKGWLGRYPALDEARVESRMRGPDLVAAAYRLALGE